MEKVLKVSAGVIRDEEGKALLCRRGYGVQAGQWEFPGGKCEEGESYAQCLVREIEEELGVVVEVVRELLQMRYKYPDKVIDLAFIEARIVKGEMQAREHSAVRWMDVKEIGKMELCAADAEGFEKFGAELE